MQKLYQNVGSHGQQLKAMADEVEARIHQYDGLTADISSVRADLTS